MGDRKAHSCVMQYCDVVISSRVRYPGCGVVYL